MYNTETRLVHLVFALKVHSLVSFQIFSVLVFVSVRLELVLRRQKELCLVIIHKAYP